MKNKNQIINSIKYDNINKFFSTVCVCGQNLKTNYNNIYLSYQVKIKDEVVDLSPYLFCGTVNNKFIFFSYTPFKPIFIDSNKYLILDNFNFELNTYTNSIFRKNRFCSALRSSNKIKLSLYVDPNYFINNFDNLTHIVNL